MSLIAPKGVLLSPLSIDKQIFSEVMKDVGRINDEKTLPGLEGNRFLALRVVWALKKLRRGCEPRFVTVPTTMPEKLTVTVNFINESFEGIFLTLSSCILRSKTESTKILNIYCDCSGAVCGGDKCCASVCMTCSYLCLKFNNKDDSKNKRRGGGGGSARGRGRGGGARHIRSQHQVDLDLTSLVTRNIEDTQKFRDQRFAQIILNR